MKRVVVTFIVFSLMLTLKIAAEDFEEESGEPQKKKRYLQDLPDQAFLNKVQDSIEEEDQGEPPISIEDYCTCPKNYEPVCGSDAKTYSNKCKFDCENRKLIMDKKAGIAIVKYYPCEEEAEL